MDLINFKVGLFKQPNGKYCIVNYGEIKHYNLTPEAVTELYVKEAQEEAEHSVKNAFGFGKIIENFLHFQRPNTASRENILKEMGFEIPYEELTKYVPQKPISPNYSSCNFATYGKCPNCHATVENGIGFKQEKCDCGQMLDWD